MTNYLRLLTPFVFIFLASCSSIYMPSVPNTPLLHTAGEFAGGAHISPKGNFNLNSAYALGNHVGVMANGAYMHDENRKKDLKHKMLEIAFGYFDTMNNDRDRIFEVYAGIGSGKSSQLFREKDDTGNWVDYEFRNAKYDKKFIQVNYSTKKKDNLKLFGKTFSLNYGTALRASFIKAHELEVNGVEMLHEDNVFLEPVFFTRMSLSDQVQLQYSAGSNIGLQNRKYLNAGHSVFSLGIVVNLGGKF